MEQFLKTYIERLRPHYQGIPEKTAHEIASAFLTFRFGIYTNTMKNCSIAIALVGSGDSNDALKKALMIVRANAEDLNNSQVTADLSTRFSESELSFVAVNLPADKIEDLGTLELDNALILLFSVAMIASPEDEQALDEHRNYVVTTLGAYKRALGIL
ncbi:MAG: hypothetical protein WC391_07085 [Methanoregula sp.]|jgi:hypothetical protein